MDVVVVPRAAGQVLVVVRGVIGPASVTQLATRFDTLLRREDEPGLDVVIDLSGVDRCDCRLLAVLHRGHHQVHASRGRLTVRGLRTEALTGFAEATLRDVFDAYRASSVVSRSVWPREAGWAGAPGRFGEPERRLAQVCVELVTKADTTDTGAAVVATTTLLSAECSRTLGVGAAVLLTTRERPGTRWAVVAASEERARVVAVAGLTTGEGPVALCLSRGEPISSPDLAVEASRWPRYLRYAARHGVRAVRALPLRGAPHPDGDAAVMIGVLVLLSDRPGPMAPADLEVAQALADLTGAALARRVAPPRAASATEPSDPAASATDHTVVERAIGVLAEREGLSIAQARVGLVRRARHEGRQLAETARFVVDGDEVAPPTDVLARRAART